MKEKTQAAAYKTEMFSVYQKDTNIKRIIILQHTLIRSVTTKQQHILQA